MATGDLNEYKIHELMAARAPIDAFGVGTELATSADAPALGVIYKLVEMEDAAGRRYPIKLSQDKQSLPGAKQVFRYANHDIVGLASESPASRPEPLLVQVIRGGKLIAPLPDAEAARQHAAESLARLPAPITSLFEGKDGWRVELSAELRGLYDRVRAGV